MYKADVGVSIEVDVAKWLDLLSQALTNKDVLELKKETAGTWSDTPVGQLTLKWVAHPSDHISVIIATFEACFWRWWRESTLQEILRETRKKISCQLDYVLKSFDGIRAVTKINAGVSTY